MKLTGYLLQKGYDPVYTYNYIRRFQEDGILYKERKERVYICLNPEYYSRIDSIIQRINDDRLTVKYDTFKRHLSIFLENNKIFRYGALENMVRKELHEDITQYNLMAVVNKAVKDKLIYYIGRPKRYDGTHDTLYASPDHFIVKRKIPTIKNLHEKIIIKEAMKKGEISWEEIRNLAENTYGSVTPQFRNAFRNLRIKKYLTYDGTYKLNPEWNYEEGFKYMPHPVKRGETMTDIYHH